MGLLSSLTFLNRSVWGEPLVRLEGSQYLSVLAELVFKLWKFEILGFFNSLLKINNLINISLVNIFCTL